MQINVILADLRQQKGWDEVKKTVESLTNIKDISNEKIKQKKKLAPQHIWKHLRLKIVCWWEGQVDKYLIYKIDEN